MFGLGGTKGRIGGGGTHAESEARLDGTTEFQDSSIDEVAGAAAAAGVVMPPPLTLRSLLQPQLQPQLHPQLHPQLQPEVQPQLQPRLESVDVGLAKLQEIRECVDNIGTDGAKFFDKGMCGG